MKHQRLLAIILASISLVAASAQEWHDPWADQQWTNGSEMLSSVRLNDSQVLLVANGYFDAGYGYLFEISPVDSDEYDLKGIAEDQVTTRRDDIPELAKMILDGENANGDDGDRWRRCTVEGMDLLIRFSNDGEVASIYEPTGREMSEIATEGIQNIILGSFATKQGTTYQFGRDGTCIWAGKNSSYEFVAGEASGIPTYHIVVNGKTWELEPTSEGMKIYLTRHDAEGNVLRKGLFVTLRASNEAPRRAFTSQRPVCVYAVENLPDKSLIRLMRNEIFARHGYVFSDPQLKAHFESCSWYKPLGDNSQVKLSEMESLNVALLKYLEKYP